MISTRIPGEAIAAKSDPVPRQAKFRVIDLLLPTSLALWALGVSRTNTTVLGQYGLLPVLPIVFYVGLALLVVSAGIELARGRPSRWRMSLHAVALVVMLYGTAPLVYSQGRYAWLYKMIGVVQYISAHGQLDHRVDIYQNWPGFFALAAWFGKVAGVASPLSYAKWAQLVFELAALPLLYCIYDALDLNDRQKWLALLLYSASNWIGQDYYSEQALGAILSLGVMAISVRWFYTDSSSTNREADRPYSGRIDRGSGRWASVHPTRLASCAVLMLVYFVLTFTHELSPYMIITQLGALVIIRLMRPVWLPVALAAIAIGYLLPRFQYVNSQYGLLNSIGDFFSNAAPPSFAAGTVPGSQLLIQRCAEALSLSMLGLALAGAWLRRRSGRTVLGLLFLAFSPFLLLAVQHYGNEGLLRAYLFSLPWTAALAASALISKPGSHRVARPDGGAFLSPFHVPGALRGSVVLLFILALFFPAFFGDDSFNVMPRSEVAVVTSFLESAPPGPVYPVIEYAPLADTARYNLFPLKAIFGTNSLMGKTPVTSHIANVIANNSVIYTRGIQPAYVMVSPSMIAFNRAYAVTPSSSFTTLLHALAHSHAWKLIVDREGTKIYELSPPTVHSSVP